MLKNVVKELFPSALGGGRLVLKRLLEEKKNQIKKHHNLNKLLKKEDFE